MRGGIVARYVPGHDLARPMADGFCWRDSVGLSWATSQFLEARYLLPILGDPVG